MDILPIGFLLLLVVISGGIAWYADELGRKLGKKRLSLFGLRPKHTAKIGTLALGIGISLFTILFVAAMSKGVRQWIFEGSKAIQQRDEKIKELRIADQNLKEVNRRTEEDQREIANLETQINDRGKKLTNQGRQIDVQRQLFKDLQKRQLDLQGRLSQTNLMIKLKDRQIHDTQASLTENQAKLSANEQRLREVRGAASTLRAQNQKLAESIQSQTNDLADLRTQKADLQTQKESLGRELETTQSELNTMSDKAAQEQQLLSQLREQEATLKNDIVEARDYVQSVVGPSREYPMIYGIGQEVTRVTVPDHLSTLEAKNALETLLKQAREIAEARGAREHARHLSADVYERDGVSPDEWKAKWIEQLAGKSTPQVAIATSYLNAFKGEPISLVIEIKDNPFVFKKGEVVAESRIDGARSDIEIYEALSHFLSNQVRAKLREKQMIPEETDEMFGSVSDDEVIKTVQTIKSAGRSVRLQAIATSDTHAADSLKLDLQVK